MIWLLAIYITLTLIYEVWAAVTQKVPTISQYCWRISKDYPLLPFLAGMVAGHLFWQG